MRVTKPFHPTSLAIAAALFLLTSCTSPGPSTTTTPGAQATDTLTPVFIPWPVVTDTPAVASLPTATLPPLPTYTPNDDPNYFYGSLVVTLDDVGDEIHLKRRQNFLLSLGEQYNWTVTIDPERVISQNMNLTPQPGEQGVYIARDSGVAQLRAVGEPRCIYSNPPCSWPTILFKAQIVVE